MADVSRRRRQPKGTPSGGEFADEDKAQGAGDLKCADLADVMLDGCEKTDGLDAFTPLRANADFGVADPAAVRLEYREADDTMSCG